MEKQEGTHWNVFPDLLIMIEFYVESNEDKNFK